MAHDKSETPVLSCDFDGVSHYKAEVHRQKDTLQVEGGKRLKKAMMPDSLHPSPEGMDAFAACLRPLLNQYGVRTAEDR